MRGRVCTPLQHKHETNTTCPCRAGIPLFPWSRHLLSVRKLEIPQSHIDQHTHTQAGLLLCLSFLKTEAKVSIEVEPTLPVLDMLLFQLLWVTCTDLYNFLTW